MFFVSKKPLKRRVLQAGATLLLSVTFTFIIIPALWGNPFHAVPKVYREIVGGITNIGIEGNTESGSSSELLFYFKGLVHLLSPVTLLLVGSSILFLAYSMIKYQRTIINHVSPLCLFSFLSFIVIILILTIALKKSERYTIILFPFLFMTAAWAVSKLKASYFALVSLVLMLSLLPQYKQIYPYFYAYGNPLFGGVKGRYDAFKAGPFGVATVAVDESIRADRKNKRKPDFYSVAAYKSFVYASSAPRVMYTPDCYVEYYVARPLERKPSDFCKTSFKLLSTVRVGNMDFWYIYKRVK
jgi:hypothetical protein